MWPHGHDGGGDVASPYYAVSGDGVPPDPGPDEVEEFEEFELAFARLAWAEATGCLQLPSQREALEWHKACCDAALAALEYRLHRGGGP